MPDDDGVRMPGYEPPNRFEPDPGRPAEQDGAVFPPPSQEPSRYEPPAARVQEPYEPPASTPMPLPCEEVRRWSGGAIIAAAVAGSIVGGILMAAAMLLLLGPRVLSGMEASEPDAAGTAQTISIDASAAGQPIQAVAAKVTPSVVSIGTEQEAVDPFTGRAASRKSGSGSGVIIGADGYILTNNHVISGASTILVTLGLDDVPAKVVGTDPSSDIAVLKVERKGLPAAELGDSEDLVVGETVVAVGSPFELDKTVTAGIVSALHRTGEASDRQQSTVYSNLIQTDAPINPGNSGGALVNLSGQVIGINTLIQTGGAQQSAGIGFAIPIKLAKQIADQLIATGKATHTFFGVATVDVTSQDAEMFGLKTETGALVQQVVDGSPAAKAGVKRGDVILRIGDKPVKDSQDMVAGVRAYTPEEKVKVLIERAGKEQTLDVTLGSSS